MVKAKLEEDGTILITCQTASNNLPSYFMKVICNGECVTEQPVQPTNVTSDLVEWEYIPQHDAQRYEFDLWAEDMQNNKGEVSRSNQVISMPAKASIESIEVLDNRVDFIKVSWLKLPRCTHYELKILQAVDSEQIQETYALCDGTTFTYRCKSPGSMYSVVVRGVINSTFGEWSDEATVLLAPGEVVLLDDAINHPVEEIHLKWESLEVHPDGYELQLYSGGIPGEPDRVNSCVTEYTFGKQWISPGKSYFVKICAYNKSGRGRAALSKKYVIAWKLPKRLIVTVDEKDPFHKATIKWDRPSGPNCFKLDIEDNHTGVTSTVPLRDNYFTFESGSPGHTYSIRLYCGYDDIIYHSRYMPESMIMTPTPPQAVEVTPGKDGTRLIVNFLDIPASRKKYLMYLECLSEESHPPKEVSTKSTHNVLGGLQPGAMYKVAVASVVGTVKSPLARCTRNVETLPGTIQNLRCKKVASNVIFEWDELKVPPKEYLVLWRIDGGDVKEDRTVHNSFSIKCKRFATDYSLCVWAVNTSGSGKKTDWHTYNARSSQLRSEPQASSEVCGVHNEGGTVNQTYHDSTIYLVAPPATSYAGSTPRPSIREPLDSTDGPRQSSATVFSDATAAAIGHASNTDDEDMKSSCSSTTAETLQLKGSHITANSDAKRDRAMKESERTTEVLKDSKLSRADADCESVECDLIFNFQHYL